MGGSGSGNFGRRSPRLTTRDVSSITLAGLARLGWISFPPPSHITLSVQRGDASAQTAVAIGTTRQPSGGERYWFHCPRCDRRCAALYQPAAMLACRRCLGLRYHSQRLTTAGRWRYRATKLFARAGCRTDDPYYYRPKGMHWTRFSELIDAAESYEEAAAGLSLVAMARRLGIAVQ